MAATLTRPRLRVGADDLRPGPDFANGSCGISYTASRSIPVRVLLVCRPWAEICLPVSPNRCPNRANATLNSDVDAQPLCRQIRTS